MTCRKRPPAYQTGLRRFASEATWPFEAFKARRAGNGLSSRRSSDNIAKRRAFRRHLLKHGLGVALVDFELSPGAYADAVHAPASLTGEGAAS